MLTLVAIVHILVAVLIVIFVLLQDSKGGAMGGMLGGGGGSNTLFGSTGAGNFLTATTKWLAVLFAITCISLAYFSSRVRSSSVLDDFTQEAAPATDKVIDTTKAGEDDAVSAGSDKKEEAPAKAASPEEKASQPQQ